MQSVRTVITAIVEAKTGMLADRGPRVDKARFREEIDPVASVQQSHEHQCIGRRHAA